MPGIPYLIDRLLVGGAVVLTCVLFWKGAADPVNVIKLTALLSCATVLAALALARAVAGRTAALPWSAAGWAGAALLGAFTISAAVAPHTTTAVLGTTGRNSGLLAYGAALLIFLVSLRVFDAASTRAIGVAVLLGGLFTALYGLLQALGIDAIPWNNPFDPIIASLGNPDFASAYMGIAVPLAVWGALHTGWHVALRVTSAATGALCLGVAAASSAVQGPIAAAAGLLVALLAVSLDLNVRRRRAAVAALASVVALAGLVLLAGVAGAGPAAPFFTGVSYEGRTWYWSAALSMFAREPLAGVGLDSYGISWWQKRPLAAPRALGGDTFSDSAHSVPLQHLAQGGLVLGLTYLAFTVAVLVALLIGLRRLRGQQRLLLGGLGGAWVAYHVQSLVSIDQVPLLLLHYVLSAGVVVAAGQSRLRVFRLPGAVPVPPAPAPAVGKARRRPVAPVRPRRRALGAPDWALLGVVAMAAAYALWQSFVPMRATTAVAAGDSALARGDGNAAVLAYDRAIDLVPGRGSHWTKVAVAYNAGGRVEEARSYFLRAFEHDPSELASLRNAASFAKDDGDVEEAKRLFRQLYAASPNNRNVIIDYARVLLQHRGAAEARDVLERATRDLPLDYDLWAMLGDARLVLEDRDGARAAYVRALEIEPQQPTALVRLPELDAAAAAK